MKSQITKSSRFTIFLLFVSITMYTKAFSQWSTNGSVLYYNTGNVGIGFSSPEEKLEISGNLKLLNSNDQVIFFQRYSDKPPASISGLPGEFSTRHGLSFNTSSVSNAVNILWNGNCGIGTASPDAKLAVKGKIHAEEVKVDLSVPGPDYVFKEGYDLKSLEEVQSYIINHGHLPNIPSAKEMEANGIELGEMNMRLLEKIEELTLYILEQEKRIKKLEKK